jgi:hypothetical protein
LPTLSLAIKTAIERQHIYLLYIPILVYFILRYLGMDIVVVKQAQRELKDTPKSL